MLAINTANISHNSSTVHQPVSIYWDTYAPGTKEVKGTMHCTSNGLKITTTELMEKKYWAINFPDRDVTINGITYHHADCLIIKD
jgi:hypothetical protein